MVRMGTQRLKRDIRHNAMKLILIEKKDNLNRGGVVSLERKKSGTVRMGGWLWL